MSASRLRYHTEMHEIKKALALFVLVAGASPAAHEQPEAKAAVVKFEIQPIKTSYRPNEEVTFRAILANRGDAPVMIERFSPCRSDFQAFVDAEIEEAKGRSARYSGCAGSEYFLPGDLEGRVNEVGNSERWIDLKPGEIYGQEISRDVKTRKGRYTIAGYFVATRFNEQQRKILADRKITLLYGVLHAPPVQISVH
jgi:hypothetical protein